MKFNVGVAYGIDQLLEPPDLGSRCDEFRSVEVGVSAYGFKLHPWVYLYASPSSSNGIKTKIQMSPSIHSSLSSASTTAHVFQPQLHPHPHPRTNQASPGLWFVFCPSGMRGKTATHLWAVG